MLIPGHAVLNSRVAIFLCIKEMSLCENILVDDFQKTHDSSDAYAFRLLYYDCTYSAYGEAIASTFIRFIRNNILGNGLACSIGPALLSWKCAKYLSVIEYASISLHEYGPQGRFVGRGKTARTHLFSAEILLDCRKSALTKVF